VRLVIFGAMAGMLVVSLCIPGAFGGDALLFACAYAIVREAQIGLFLLASRGDARLRQSVWGLAAGTTLGAALLIIGALIGGTEQQVLWVVALALDMAEPYFFGSEGWKLAPSHFAERHGLIMIIALGESIVAIGVGAGAEVDAGVVVAAIVGIVIAAALWWLYFDVVARVAEHRLANAEAGREQNDIARDSYSYLHFPMVAGIVLIALGVKKTLGHVEDPLKLIPTVALLGGSAAYLLAHVAFRYRNIHTLNRQRLLVAIAALLFIPVAKGLPALIVLAILAAALVALIVYEAVRFAEARDRIRHRLGEA
jgi:low temperature requirement protein LtrA